jgi:hypothetical protein
MAAAVKLPPGVSSASGASTQVQCHARPSWWGGGHDWTVDWTIDRNLEAIERSAMFGQEVRATQICAQITGCLCRLWRVARHCQPHNHHHADAPKTQQKGTPI